MAANGEERRPFDSGEAGVDERQVGVLEVAPLPGRPDREPCEGAGGAEQAPAAGAGGRGTGSLARGKGPADLAGILTGLSGEPGGRAPPPRAAAPAAGH
jgi:hypothetical protein